MAETLAGLVDSFSKRASVVYETELTSASASSQEIWLTCRPPVSASSLRYATLHLPSVWASSALCELADAKLDGLLGQMSQERETIAHALAQPTGLLAGLEPSASGKAYAFEHPLGLFQASVAQLRSRQKARSKKKPRSKDSTPEQLIGDRVRSLVRGGDVEAVAWALRAASFSDNVRAAPIWESFSDPEWREAVLTEGSRRAVELITEAAMELVARDQDHDWRSYLPHFLAVAAETESLSQERRRTLLDLTALVSISVDSVSAIERLLKGVHRNNHAEAVNEWRTKIELVTPQAPAWIAARMRGMKAVLYVA